MYKSVPFKLASLIFLGSLLSCPHAFCAPTYSVEGFVPRDDNVTAIDLTIAIQNVTAAEIGDNLRAAIQGRLKIKLVDHEQNDLAIGFPGTPGSFLEGYFINFISDPKQERVSNTGTNYNITTSVRIYQSSPTQTFKDLLKASTGSSAKVISVKVGWLQESEEIEENEYTIAQILAVVQEGHKDLSIKSYFRSLLISWTKADKVAYSDGKSYAPRGSTVIFIPASKSGISLAARVFSSGSPSADPLGACTLSADASSCSVGSCVRSDGTGTAADKYYLDVDAIKAAHSFAKVAEVAGSDASLSKGDLDSDQVYAAIVSYEPDGYSIGCVVGKPKVNFSLTELDGNKSGKKAKEGDPSCFVATATYGTPFHEDIDQLRWFRDQILMRTPVGRSIVEAYYDLSPPLADFVSRHEWARVLSRALLWPPIQLIKWYHRHGG